MSRESSHILVCISSVWLLSKHPRRSSSSSCTSMSTKRESYLEFSTNSSLGHRHRYPKWKHRRQTTCLSSCAKSKLKRLSVPCCPPLPKRYAARIERGEYVSFNKLTITEKYFSKQAFSNMGRWSSDCYRSYIHTPHRILRSLTSKLCTS